MPIVAAKDVHVVLVDDARVRVARAGPLLGIQWLQLLPSARLDAVLVEVINSVVAIVATEDVDAATVNHSCVAVSGARRLRAAVRIELTPVVRRKVEAEKVVPAVGAIVAAENVEIVV